MSVITRYVKRTGPMIGVIFKTRSLRPEGNGTRRAERAKEVGRGKEWGREI